MPCERENGIAFRALEYQRINPLYGLFSRPNSNTYVRLITKGYLYVPRPSGAVGWDRDLITPDMNDDIW